MKSLKTTLEIMYCKDQKQLQEMNWMQKKNPRHS